MTQERVAELAGINPKYLGEIEGGEKNPTVLLIQKIAVALDVPLCMIIPSNSCLVARTEVLDDIARVLHGKSMRDQQKAVRILEIVFDS